MYLYINNKNIICFKILIENVKIQFYNKKLRVLLKVNFLKKSL